MKILVVGIGSHREFGLSSLRLAGHFVGVIDSLDRIPVHSVDWYAWGNPRDIKSVCDAVKQSGHRWDAAVCWDELSLETLPLLWDSALVPTPQLRAKNFRDKSVMRKTLKQAGLLTPEFRSAGSAREGLEASQHLTWPIVVKPVDYGGSSGVMLVQGCEDLEPAVQHALSKSRRKLCILEEYVAGQEFSVETVTWGHGRHTTFGVTLKQTTEPPYFVEITHCFPAQVDERTEAELIVTAHSALEALGMGVGASHAEIKVTPRGPVVIEVAGRLAGDMIPDLISMSTGVNPYICELDAVLGKSPPPITKSHPGGTSGICFFTGVEGKVISWPSPETCAQHDALSYAVKDIKFWYPPGVACPPMNSNGRRLGYAIVQGTADHVRTAMDELRGLYPHLI